MEKDSLKLRKIKQACNELTQSSKGFLLIDFLLAFGCLVMFIIFLLPVIYHAMNHNQSLQQAMVAEDAFIKVRYSINR